MLLTVGCGGGSKDTKPAANADKKADAKVTLKLAHNFPATHPIAKASVSFAEKVKAKTNGSITVTVYPSGQLYNDKSMNDAIMSGGIDMGMNTVGRWSTVIPAMEVFDVPFLFPTYAKVDAAIDGGLGKKLGDELLKKGVRAMIWADYGFVQFCNAKRPITKPEDFAGLKLRGYGEMPSETIKALGASPVTMVDGVLLLVDAYEGPMPQTKYVLRKALEHHLKPIVVINKIDRPDQRVEEVVDEVLDLFIELNATENQLDFPVVYASAKAGIAKLHMEDESNDLQPLFKVILDSIPAPDVEVDKPLQLLVNTLDYDDYVGRIVVGRIVRGTIHNGEQISLMHDDKITKQKIGRLYTYQGLKRTEVQEVSAGDIIALIGLPTAEIGDTIADAEQPEQLEGIKIDEPTLSMVFAVNDGPFAGQEGDFVTSRHLRERLFKEMETNVSMKLEETDQPDAFKVSGRGELHLSVLIESMRREGYELQVGKPKVIMNIFAPSTIRIGQNPWAF